MATIAEKLAEAAVTDSLNRAENPIGAPWVKMNPATSAGKCVNVAPVGYTPVTSFATGEDDCYWSTSAFSSTASQYIYAIFTLNRVGSTERQTGVWLCRDETKPVETQNGYLLRLERKAGANEIKFTIEKWVGGAAEVIKEMTTTAFIAGAKIALVVGNGKAYMFASTTEGGTFEEQMSVETATYTKGYSGMRAKGTGEFIIKDFRTGTFTLYAGETTRQFSKSPASQILTNVGSPVAGEHAMVAIVKYEEDGNIIKAVTEANADFEPTTELAINLGGLLGWGSGSGMSVPKSTWVLIGFSKAAGTVKPRFHMYNFSTKTWTHAEGTTSRGEGTIANWKRFRIGGKTNSVGPFKGVIAAIARYNKALSDSQFEALTAAPSIGAWAGLATPPVALWELGQVNVAEELLDLIGSANQTSREETTVLEEAPPMPYTSVGKFVKVLVGGVVKEVKRWVLVGGSLVSK